MIGLVRVSFVYSFGKGVLMYRCRLLALICVACAFTGSGCATIVNSGPDVVFISTTPAGATVTIDGAQVGKTPLTAQVRRDSHMITFSKEGHQEVTLPVQKNFNPWVLGNLIFGGVIGIVVDAVTGNLEEVTGSIVVTLPKVESGDSRPLNRSDSIAAWLGRVRKFTELSQTDPPGKR